MDNEERVDEVEIFYGTAKKLDRGIGIFFWLSVVFSLGVAFPNTFQREMQDFIQVIFVVLVITHFVCNLLLTLYYLPFAEKKRRRQLLSNAFDTPITQESTSLYYNNEFSPSIAKLGANVMENSLFSKSIAEKMLPRERLINICYVLIWLFIVLSRQTNLEIILWLTQFLFSTSIVARWINLELLRYRHEQTYDTLYNAFLSGSTESKKFFATVLDAYASYEAAKAAAPIILSSKVFEEMNPEITSKWNQVRFILHMDEKSLQE